MSAKETEKTVSMENGSSNPSQDETETYGIHQTSKEDEGHKDEMKEGGDIASINNKKPEGKRSFDKVQEGSDDFESNKRKPDDVKEEQASKNGSEFMSEASTESSGQKQSLTEDQEQDKAHDQEATFKDNRTDSVEVRERLDSDQKVKKDEGEDEHEDEDEDEEDDEDEDEEAEEDEDEDEINSRKKKRRRVNQFLDIEAEVDDEEEDELDEDDEEAELLREQFIDDDHRHTEGEEALGNHDDRLHRQFDRRRQEEEDQDAEVLAETLKQRYRKSHAVYRGDTTASGTVSQKLLMPSINDPAIYAVRCSPGREKDLVRKLYEKKRTLARLKHPLEVLTVFQRDAFRGYIYIEAKKPEAIDRALAGMVNVYSKQRLLVPVREYPDLLKQVKSSDVEIVPGIYVRITRGKYKGDLAIVDNLSENGLDVRCKLVPRLDYGKNDDFDREGKRIRLKVKPIPRLFNEHEARSYDAEYLQPGRGPRSFIYRGEEYQDGFLYKDFKLQFIQTKDVHPRLEELDRFQSGNNEEDGLDLAAIAASLKNQNSNESGQSTNFQPGDKVEVRRGEQARTVGKVLSVATNEVTMLVTDSGDPKFVNQLLTVPANDLRKVFVVGDHVRIVDGKHSGETGLVIKIDNDSVVLLSDQSNEDIRVFANYLIKGTDTTMTTESAGNNFDVKDLVQLNVSTVGVIVRAEKGAFDILTTEGRLLTVKPSGIASKLNLSRREQVATDKYGSNIKVGDTVKEVIGDKKREGVIIHIYKNYLFIKLNEILENLGIFAANSMNVSTISTKGSMVSKNLESDLTRLNPNLKLPKPINNAIMQRQGGRDKLLNHDVVVSGGNYKGLMGKVTDTDEQFARIELHTKSKRIKVKKTQLNVLVRGESVPYLRFIGAPANSSNSSFMSNKSTGPAFSSGMRSSWGAGSGMTPAAGAGGASAWRGGKTPVYSSGGGTSWGANGNSTLWGNGGASSWGNAGNSTAWGANGGGSTWGGASTWGAGRDKNGSTSTWGGASSWGNSNKGSRSTWGSGSTWGGN